MPTKTRLTPSEYDEISFVDAGANQEAHILIFKAAPKQETTTPPKNTATKSPAKAKPAKPREKKTSQRARNWVEENHKRRPKGDPLGGHFAPANGKQGKSHTSDGRLKGAKTVKKGDTLWAYAEAYLGDGRRWKEIAKLNGIKDPRKLQIGAQIKIPGGTIANPGSWAGEKPRTNTKEQQEMADRARRNGKRKKAAVVRKPATKKKVSRKPATKPAVVRKPGKKTSNYRTGSRAVPV